MFAMHYLWQIPCRVFCLIGLIWTVFYAPIYNASDNSQTSPAYSILYDQLCVLERKGEHLDALRLIPAIYASEIPVDAFYETLERKRRRLLGAVIGDGQARIGKTVFKIDDLRDYLIHTLGTRPDRYRQAADVDGIIEFERFLYLACVLGGDSDSSKNNLLIEGVLREIPLLQALRSPDPWLVGGALYLARKSQSPTISPQAVIDRWELRPDLWDTTCTQQALLFLDRASSDEIKSLKITNEDVRSQIKTLRINPKLSENVPE